MDLILLPFTFIAPAPDRPVPVIDFGAEELRHFHSIVEIDNLLVVRIAPLVVGFSTVPLSDMN